MQLNNFVGQLLKSMLVMIQLDTHGMQLKTLQIESYVNPPRGPQYLSKQNKLINTISHRAHSLDKEGIICYFSLKSSFDKKYVLFLQYTVSSFSKTLALISRKIYKI